MKDYLDLALQEETSRTNAAVGGTLLSHEIYQYRCRECENLHFTKEGAAEICLRTFDKEDK